MIMSSIVAHLYLFFSQHRLMVFAATVASIIISIIAFAHLNLSENIDSMLPDNKTDTALDFKLLQQAPFSRKVVINLKKGANGNENELMEAGDRLAQGDDSSFFHSCRLGDRRVFEFGVYFVDDQSLSEPVCRCRYR